MAMRSPLGPLLANVFMSSTEESERVNSLPSIEGMLMIRSPSCRI